VLRSEKKREFLYKASDSYSERITKLEEDVHRLKKRPTNYF